MATIKSQAAYEEKIFQEISQNIRNDIDNLDVCIKEMRRSLERGKALYIQCTKSNDYVSNITKKMKEKEAEIHTEENLLSNLNMKISDIEKNISKYMMK